MPAPKTKGGKPASGASSVDSAAAAVAAGLVRYQAQPEAYDLFIVEEDEGIPKKGVSDYLLKAVSVSHGGAAHDVIVPKDYLSKNGKLAVKEMGVKGARVAIATRLVKKERLSTIDGVTKVRPFMETEHVVVAVLP
jgi:hypothetical protein